MAAASQQSYGGYTNNQQGAALPNDRGHEDGIEPQHHHDDNRDVNQQKKAVTISDDDDIHNIKSNNTDSTPGESSNNATNNTSYRRKDSLSRAQKELSTKSFMRDDSAQTKGTLLSEM